MILVFVETADGVVEETSLETIRFARDLAAEGGGVPISALMVGEAGDVARKQLGEHGVATLYAAVGPDLGVVRRSRLGVCDRGRAGAGEVGRGDRGRHAARQRAAGARGCAARRADGRQRGVVPRPVSAGRHPAGDGRLGVGGDAAAAAPAIFSVAGHAVEARPAEQVTEPAVVEVRPEIAAADLVDASSRPSRGPRTTPATSIPRGSWWVPVEVPVAPTGSTA